MGNLDDKTKEEKKPRIDPSTSPYTEHNLDAAKKLDVKYDPDSGVYRDNEGCQVLDSFGQPLG